MSLFSQIQEELEVHIVHLSSGIKILVNLCKTHCCVVEKRLLKYSEICYQL